MRLTLFPPEEIKMPKRFTVSIMLSMNHNHNHQSKFITLCQDSVLGAATETDKPGKGFCTTHLPVFNIFCPGFQKEVSVITEPIKLSAVGQWCNYCTVVFLSLSSSSSQPTFTTSSVIISNKM